MSLYIHIILRLIYYCFYSPYVHIVFQHWSILPHPALDRGKAWRGLWSQRIGLRALQMFGGPGPGSKWLVWHKKETMGRGFQDLPSVMVLFTCPNLPSVTCSYWFIYGFILECLAVSCAWTIVMHGTRGSAAKCDQSWSMSGSGNFDAAGGQRCSCSMSDMQTWMAICKAHWFLSFIYSPFVMMNAGCTSSRKSSLRSALNLSTAQAFGCLVRGNFSAALRALATSWKLYSGVGLQLFWKLYQNQYSTNQCTWPIVCPVVVICFYLHLFLATGPPWAMGPGTAVYWEMQTHFSDVLHALRPSQGSYVPVPLWCCEGKPMWTKLDKMSHGALSTFVKMHSTCSTNRYNAYYSLH